MDGDFGHETDSELAVVVGSPPVIAHKVEPLLTPMSLVQGWLGGKLSLNIIYITCSTYPARSQPAVCYVIPPCLHAIFAYRACAILLPILFFRWWASLVGAPRKKPSNQALFFGGTPIGSGHYRVVGSDCRYIG